MSAGTLLPDAIRDELAAMQRQDRELTALRGLGRGLSWICLAWAACLVADALWNLSPAVRAGMLAAAAMLTLFAAWRFVWRPLFHRRSWTELAAAVERDHPELAERLVTLVELEAEPGRGGSPVMQALLAKQTAKAVLRVNFTDSLPAGKSLQTAAIGLIALALLLLPFLLPGQRYALLWGRLMMPFGNHAWGTHVAIRVLDGDRVVPRGDDVVLVAELQGLSAEQQSSTKLRFEARDTDGRSREHSLTWQPEEQNFTVKLPRIEHDLTYRIASRWAASPEYRLTVANRPAITAWSIDIEPPPYTGLPATTLQAAVAELRVPERSRIAFRWEFAEPVSAGVIDWPTVGSDGSLSEAESALTLSADGRSATSEQSVFVGGPFRIRLTNPLGLESDEPERRLTLIADEPPAITVTKDDVPRKVRPDDVLAIPASARDDYGLSAWELHWETSAGEKGIVTTPADLLTERTMETEWTFALAERSLSGGQAVTLRFRAADHYPAPGPNETWSEPLVISISTDVDSLESRAVAEAQESLEKNLDALRETVAKQQEAVDQHHRQTARAAVKGDQQPENRDALEELRQRQEALQKQLAAVQEELAQRPFLEQAAGERMPAVEAALSSAEESLTQAAEKSEARDQIENLSRALDELGQAQEQLDKLSQETKALAALEQELAELARLSRRAEQLADQAEKLSNPQSDDKSPSPQADSAAKSENDSAAEQADRETLDTLRRETGDLSDRLDELLDRRPELLEAARNQERGQLEKLGEVARRMAERQEQLADELSDEAAENAASENRPADAAAPGDDSPQSDSPSSESMTSEAQASAEESAESSDENGEAASKEASDQATRGKRQQRLSEAADALTRALAESAERLSQSPLNMPAAGENAAAAAQGAAAAQEAMESADEQLSQGKAAADEARAAQRQLQEAANRASQGDPNGSPPSPSSARIPGAAAGQVTEAARQLQQAQEQLQNAEPGNNDGNPGESDSKSAPTGESSDEEPKASGEGPEGSGKKPEAGEGTPSSGENAGEGSNPMPGEGTPNSKSAMTRSAEQLRQAARALSVASQSKRPATSMRSTARKGSKSSEPGKNSDAERSDDPNMEPGESPELSEGFAEFGAGSTAAGDESASAADSVRPRAGSRNWGRLPQHLRSEIRQGATKTPHPEYAPQIKRYFERIAEPAKPRRRP